MKYLTLVTGVTGRHGSTGYMVARNLLSRGLPVRVMFRHNDEKVTELVSLGAEAIQADYHNLGSLKPALQGIEQAYFCYPVNTGILEATANFCTAARETGLRFIVNNSMGASHPLSPSHLGRCQWLSEQIFSWAGFQCVHLRGAFFYENLLLLHQHSIVKENELRSSFGESLITWVSSEDMAAVAAEVLGSEYTEWDSHLVITSDETLSYEKIAESLSKILKRKISYRFMSQEKWRADLQLLQGTNNAMIEHLIKLTALLSSKTSMPKSDVVVNITGRKPKSLYDIVDTHRDAFGMG